ncbi:MULTISPECIES: PaaI family thioesterase [Paenibacillus]|uniref:Thioesterase superfamily protein n=1 Tax=Paenibacillus sabinae T27 TaxID=1268072 RepID=X4ZFY2_9BACL|nr:MULTISPECIES: PaaI family thioesterase [Paenibacillus]AHV95660.1 thioesterase superfamily protein [Paenibacillus sabinae T27]
MDTEQTPLFALLGFAVSYDEDNKVCRIECPVQTLMLNPLGIVHGGIHAYLADTAFGFLTIQFKDVPYVSLETKTSYMKSAAGGRLIADARFVKDGYKALFLECRVENEQREVLSVTTGTFLRVSSVL